MTASLRMSDLGLTERPKSINDWIDVETEEGVRRTLSAILVETFENDANVENLLANHNAPMIRLFGEIARGAVLHVIADKATLIDNLSKACHANSVAAGWWNDLETGEDLHGKRNIGELMMLMVSEIAEGFEGVRKNQMSDKIVGFTNEEEELADLLHRVFDFAGSRGLRLGAAFIAKERYNATREDHKPENRRKDGGKRF